MDYINNFFGSNVMLPDPLRNGVSSEVMAASAIFCGSVGLIVGTLQGLFSPYEDNIPRPLTTRNIVTNITVGIVGIVSSSAALVIYGNDSHLLSHQRHT